MSYEVPAKCNECPMLFTGKHEIEAAEREYDEAIMKTMSDDIDQQAEREHLLSEKVDSDYAGCTKQEIAVHMRKDLAVGMEAIVEEIDDTKKDMARYAMNCDGAVFMQSQTPDGRIVQATVCGSKAVESSDDPEPVMVNRVRLKRSQ